MEAGMRKYAWTLALLMGLLAFALVISAGIPQEKASSRAYVGHENDRDINNFIRQFPNAAGTRLDDCQTCHRGGVKGTDTEREFNPCGYCHLLEYPNPGYKTGVPQNYKDTLNAFGLAYEKAGRTVEALAEIAKLDADGDGFANAAEIAELRYPGDAGSRPGQPLAPVVLLSERELRKLPPFTQFMLMNATKEMTDDYVSYTGVRLADVLAASGADLKGAAGITVFAPDGYSIECTIEEITRPFPRGYFYSGPAAFKDSEKSFVRYPEAIPAGVEDGREIPGEPWLLLAFERGGKPLDDSYYEKGTGRLAGEGPFRLVKPQRNLRGDPAKPGRPDRSVKAKVFGDGWDFNPAIDHNAGACARGACVIRVNPAPAGFEEYDWKNGWPLIKGRKIAVFGYGVKS
jgi:hypothetical protein